MRDWVSIVDDAGWPAVILVIDFESFFSSKVTLSGMSIVEYISHPEFELTGCGFGYITRCEGCMDPYFVPGPMIKEHLEKLKRMHGKDLSRVVVAAKNAKFDMLILAVKFGIYPKYTLDVEDLTRTYDSRMKQRLEDVAPLFKIGYKGDTNKFKGLHYQDIIDKKMLSDLESYTLNDIEKEQLLIYKLLPIIDNPEIELPLAAHTLRLYTKPTIDFDFKLCDKLIADMEEEIQKALRDVTPWVLTAAGFSEQDIDDAFECDAWVELVSDIIGKNLRFVPLLMKALPKGQSVPLKPGKPVKNMIPLTGPGKIPALAKTDDGCKWLIAHPDPLVSSLMSARQALNSWPSHIKRLKHMRAQSKASFGKFRVPLKYHGAHTGRWSGEEYVNAGNLGGTGRGKAISKLISAMRHTLKAPVGQLMALVDAAQIEARNLAWYADQHDLVKLFKEGGDPYSDLATAIFQCKVWKWKDDDVEEYPGQKGKVKIYRGFGKDAILGCGYGMGWLKFYTNCLENDVLRPLFDKGDYDEDFIKGLIRTYRTKYKMIPKFWSKVESAWRKATKFKMEVKCGRLIFDKPKGSSITYIILPSSRRLRYRHSVVTHDDELRHHHGVLWGGSITENVVQATCRDFLANWILEIEERTGRRVVHHVYDEIITMASKNNIETVKDIMIDVMSHGPDWADGMPFEAEGMVSEYYTK